MLTNALVVFRFWQDLVVLTVGQDEYRTLNTAQELLDDHAGRSVAEHTAEHLLELLLGLFEGRENQNALTGTQPVGLEYIRRLKGFKEGKSFFHMLTVECLIFSGRNVVTLHESLGEVLTAFEYGTFLRRTDNWNTGCAFIAEELIVDALYQGILRSYDHHVNEVVHDKVFQFVELVHSDRHVLSDLRGTCISRGNEQFLAFLALGDFPSKGVFTTATAQQ